MEGIIRAARPHLYSKPILLESKSAHITPTCLVPSELPNPHQYARSIPVCQTLTSARNRYHYTTSPPVCKIFCSMLDLPQIIRFTLPPSYPTPAPDPLVCWLHLYPCLLQYSRCLPVHWVHSCGPDVFPSVSSGKPRVGTLGLSSLAHSFNHLPRIQSQNNSFCCFGNEFSTHANCSLTLNTHVGGGSAFSCLLGEGGGHHRGGFVVVLLADRGGSLPLINRFTNTI